MATPLLTAQIERYVRDFEPEGTLVNAWPLEGGMSATMVAFEIELPGGERRKRIARQPNLRHFGRDPDAALEEYRVLAALQKAGLPVQTPYFVCPASDAFPHPFVVIEYIEGRPEVAPSDPEGFIRRYAERLAEIHRVDYARFGLDFLPKQGRGFGRPPEVLNDSLREPEIRAALESVSLVQSNSPVLRHGDFWPGNVLWRDGEIVAVIDWEECLIGEPLADLAISRLDIWWILGRDAAFEFTERFLSLTGIESSALPYWDLCASLRPIANLPEWSPAYPHLGRPDITEATMTRDHQDFVEQALRAFHFQ
ncbi:phosphotransferase family protein [Fimbriimonas ginsengisoli]|uniref:Aminoglycoside phosphotransferase domain-containing protein n=1 Tax=Fimbriimonas ginsengisoli Gsoil 348 TaxID=661478 RepID=A0A068NZ40_FIMGI|nr:phosphotransferase family protein [Fimbriimonas ginsengisoli]AIE87909.1 hypothetical protein OP10G_4541 [Fimbriimonas ginsengisoli Gsoil 348]